MVLPYLFQAPRSQKIYIKIFGPGERALIRGGSLSCLLCNKTCTKREDVTKQGFSKILWIKIRLRESLLFNSTYSISISISLSLTSIFSEFSGTAFSMSDIVGGGWGGGGRFFGTGRLLPFSAIRMGAYSRWALIRGSALIWINTVFKKIYIRHAGISLPNGSLLLLMLILQFFCFSIFVCFYSTSKVSFIRLCKLLSWILSEQKIISTSSF